MAATVAAPQASDARRHTLTPSRRFLLGCTLCLTGALACAETFAQSNRLGLQIGPYVHHWDHEPDHKNTPGLFGLEYETAERWNVGAAFFRNSFDQASEYYYAGKSWPVTALDPDLYVKLTAGALLGYSGRYEDKIPLNHKGVAFAVIPALGYRYDRYNAQLALLGTAGVMFTFGIDLARW
jgi:hypothetical protein